MDCVINCYFFVDIQKWLLVWKRCVCHLCPLRISSYPKSWSQTPMPPVNLFGQLASRLHVLLRHWTSKRHWKLLQRLLMFAVVRLRILSNAFLTRTNLYRSVRIDDFLRGVFTNGHDTDNPPPCTLFYLAENCKWGASCQYSHHYLLQEEHYAELRAGARKSPCPFKNKSKNDIFFSLAKSSLNKPSVRDIRWTLSIWRELRVRPYVPTWILLLLCENWFMQVRGRWDAFHCT